VSFALGSATLGTMHWRQLTSVGRGYPVAVAMVVVTVLLVLPFRPLLSAPTIMLLCVPVIVIIARLYGAWVSTTAAAIASFALDLLFVPPYYHINIAEPAEWIALLVFLAVALISGQQTGRLRERERAAVRRQRQLELLNRMTVQIALEDSAQTTAEFIVGALAGTLGVDRVALYALDPDAGTPRPTAVAGAPDAPEAEARLVAWVAEHNTAIGLPSAPIGHPDLRPLSVGPAEAIPGLSACGTYLPLQTSDSLEGVLCILETAGRPLGPEEVELVLSAANLAAASLKRQQLEDATARAMARQEADRLRATFLSSVSHELKTPLAAATARVTGLVDEGGGRDAARTHEELGEVAEDLGRLNSLIGDLLDLSRLEADAWRPDFEPADVRDILGTVLSRLPSRDRGRVRFAIPDGLPQVMADYAQLTRAFSNLVENALVYSPPGSPVSVSAWTRSARLEIAVEDEGPGVAPHERMRIFDKFYRGTLASAMPSGTGLGLAISHEIIRSHRGELWVEPGRPTGARFVVSLPVAEEEQ